MLSTATAFPQLHASQHPREESSRAVMGTADEGGVSCSRQTASIEIPKELLIEVHRCVLVLFDNGPSRHSKGEMLKESQRSSSDFLGLSLSGPEQDFLREK